MFSQYKYRFCGFPIGVSILPRLAAIVCRTITGTASFFTASSPVSRSTMKVNGTNVINDTSLVMIILKMKHNSTNTSANCMVFCVCRNSVFAILRKTPSFCKPAITVIRQKRIESVRKSIYPAYSLSGGIITADTIASRIATVRTVSLLGIHSVFSLLPYSFVPLPHNLTK